MQLESRMFVSGDEAVALAALDGGVRLGTGYPGTPSTEILEFFAQIGGKAQWAPNEKVALEVGLGSAFAGARTLVTMKHVGVNVAADPLFTATYTDTKGGLVLVSADDPGMASSQNEQDNRRYAVASGIPCIEPSDSQEAYDFTLAALDLAERWRIPVMLRITTRICHSKTIVERRKETFSREPAAFDRDIPRRVMIPAYARSAHRTLRAKLAEIQEWNEGSDLNHVDIGATSLGIITSGISYVHTREAAPEASVLKLTLTHPLPLRKIRQFVDSVDRCVVIEEGDPYLVENLRAAGMHVEGKPEMYRFGELNVNRARRILAGDTSEEPAPPRGTPPRLCPTCPHRVVFRALSNLGCIVSGDIGCYTLGVLPPFEAMDSCVCMGASVGVGLGMRHVLPPEDARRVVSVIGDSTFVHSGITGLVEMAYNPPPTGHVVILLDNGTTAMTGMQEHPGTGRALDHTPAHKLSFERLAESIGIRKVHLTDPVQTGGEAFEQLVKECLDSGELVLLIVRRLCALVEPRVQALEAAASETCNA
jgi:indolepyruvate ferredoxin oxidoreductase, alpha subunit